MKQHNPSALARIANLSPATLREIVYVHEPYTRREQVKRHYRTKGELVAAVYNLYLDGTISHIANGPSIPDQHQAGVP